MDYEFDLGSVHRPITTNSPEAQQWFDRGLAWTYGFNHEEAVTCFRHSVEADPECAMAHWGIAYAIGPNYNKQWDSFDEDDAARSLATAFDSAMAAHRLSTGCNKPERDLIGALLQRYQQRIPADDMLPWNDDYATAMREVWRENRNDADIEALFAEALMNRTPWQLWDIKTGEIAPGADTAEAQAVLEPAIRRLSAAGSKPHPGLLHMYIHLMELSPTPEKALPAADMLRGLVPDSGHLQHMATHIDTICGDYLNVVRSNHDAVIADRRYLEKEGPLNFYTLYRAHNYHFKIYGAMFLGQYRTAIQTCNELLATLPEELLVVESPPMADWLEAFVAVKQHVLVRFGRWQDILGQELPDNRELYCATTTTMHYARAVARASSLDPRAARDEADAFETAFELIPESRSLFNNTCRDILSVGREMMMGEILYREGEFDAAFERLRKAVELDDSLPYDEPWAWMQPVRHALGALLLEQGRIEDASAVYLADLGLDDTLGRPCQHLDNIWSLSGYCECLDRLGLSDQARTVRQRLKIAQARADIPVTASCYCKLSAGVP